ncbi:MAG TPA: lysyl oxidase family protein [Nocardioidaceae bacterium]|nr:lysyl oxidase family protein [Nocardioidaceae bacterium]
MKWRKYGALSLTSGLVAAMFVALWGTASSAATPITVGSGSSSVTGVDVTRTSNALVKYTPAYGASTRTNTYGFEAAVVGGKVTQVANGVGNMAIPSNGFVLSGHGTQRTFLSVNAKVGVTVSEGGTTPPPSGGTPETASRVTLGGPTTTRAISAHNVRRLSNQLIRYTRAWGATTDQNAFGFEAAVLNGRVTQVADRVGNLAIPDGGYVLSGHGTEATWLRANARVGVTAVLDTDNAPVPSPTPTPTPPPTGGVPSDALLPDLMVHKLDRTINQDPSGNHGFFITNTGGQKLLKFPAITANVGRGPLEIRGTRSSTAATDWVGRQVVTGANGAKTTLGDSGASFYFAGDGHNHWHIRDFDKYEILDAAGTSLKLGEKHGYCFEDNTSRDSTWSVTPAGPQPASPVFANATSCGNNQPNATSIVHGLSVGWADTYPSSLPDQAIDITGLPDGTYTIRVTADWQGFWRETNDANNVATTVVRIAGNTVTFVSANTGL